MKDKIGVSVNHNKCVGSQICVILNPEVFTLNEEGQSTVIAVNDDVARIIYTAEQCPQSAIVVEKADSGERLFPPPKLDK